MARKKIVSEEEVSKPAMAEETTEANADDAAPADLMPGSNTPLLQRIDRRTKRAIAPYR